MQPTFPSLVGTSAPALDALLYELVSGFVASFAAMTLVSSLTRPEEAEHPAPPPG